MPYWKSQTQLERLKTLFQVMDLTSLRTHDPFFNLAQLCERTHSPLGDVASLCVYPCWVSRAKELLIDNPVRVCTVVNFPVPALSATQIGPAIQEAILTGADEVDVVLPYQLLIENKSGDYAAFVRACKDAISSHVLFKGILETGALKTPGLIDQAACLAIEGGVDFIKTSTGVDFEGATVDVARRLAKVIYDSGRPVGLKVSGGIKTIDQAVALTNVVVSAWGDQSIVPSQYRIGASRLRGQLVNAALMAESL